MIARTTEGPKSDRSRRRDSARVPATVRGEAAWVGAGEARSPGLDAGAERLRLAPDVPLETLPASVAARFAQSDRRDAIGQGVFLLAIAGGALELRPPGEHRRPGIRAEFPPDRDAGPSQARNPLARAFGRRIDCIHDLSAGLGADAYRLAAAGYRVLAVERDPVVYALLASGWASACAGEHVPAGVAARLAFSEAEATDVIADIAAPDIGVYFDPMYPAPRRASAKPKRALQVMRAWLAESAAARGQARLDEQVELIEAARARAARVVVKRPHHAKPLVDGVDFASETKLVRFDVYLNPARMGARKA